LMRGRILVEIRRFFFERDFIEAETPIVVACPGMEPNLDPFRTEVKEMDGVGHPAFLITSPECSLKKLLAGGLEKVFEITKCFRNREPWSGQAGDEGGRHNPEFTMIEWYRAGTDYTVLMEDTESLVSTVVTNVLGRPHCSRTTWQGIPIDFSAPWPRLSVAEAFQQYARIDLLTGIDNPDQFRSVAAKKGIEVSENDLINDVFFRIFLQDIEPKLGMPSTEGEVARPVILYDYPKSMAALARLKPEDERLAERFEVYCCGLELGNAFSELTDAKEQRHRLEEEQAERQRLGKAILPIDEQFLEAVGTMPESAGIAFGLDRLVMLLTDSRDIRDVLFFPAEDLFM
ncbi:MAG: EF-P lysine aminoacylase GenX, partial [candidate division Zixibacteria bacterium]|nr:EF-P lysine aminoacylase GenX [candidate division Zixibacteria bacterium]